MGDTVKTKKRWFLKAELVVLVCVVCIWVVRSGTIDIDSIKAGLLTTYNLGRARKTASFEVAATNSQGAQLNGKPGAVPLTGQLRKPAESEPIIQELPANQGMTPGKMLAERERLEQRQVTQWFDQMRCNLDQQALKPEEYRRAYMEIMMQAQQRGLEVSHRHQAMAQRLEQVYQLVKEGQMSREQADQIAWRMAGIPR